MYLKYNPLFRREAYRKQGLLLGNSRNDPAQRPVVETEVHV